MSSNFSESLFQKVSWRETETHLMSTSDLTDTHIQSRERQRGGREQGRERRKEEGKGDRQIDKVTKESESVLLFPSWQISDK